MQEAEAFERMLILRTEFRLALQHEVNFVTGHNICMSLASPYTE